jgi:uncharacterized membrane protein
MNDSQPEFDPTLAERFRAEHAHIADDSFVGATVKRVVAERARTKTVRRALQLAAVLVVIAASPWLIRGSVLVSEVLDQGFARASEWLARPTVITIAAVAVAVALAYRLLQGRAHR